VDSEVWRASALESFALRLRAERQARSLTQEELAQRAGIRRVHAQQLQRGWSDRSKRSPANPKLDTLLALASQLGIRIVIDVAHPEGLVIRIDEE